MITSIRTTARVLAFLLLLSLMLPLIPAAAAPAQGAKGMTFTASDNYQTFDPLPAVPRTFEAWIRVDANAPSSRLGVIAGNYSEGNTLADMNFEIRTNGNPAIWWKEGGSAKGKTTAFTKIDLRTGKQLHLAIVSTPTKVSCYINGELMDEVSGSFPDVPVSMLNRMMLGGDFRGNNVQSLKSTELYSAAFFSDARTPDEIKADMQAIDRTDSALIGAYDLTAAGKERLRDASPAGNHLIYSNTADPGKTESWQTLETADEGIFFTSSDNYRIERTFDALPNTVEASVFFPKNFASSQRGGVILGNYGGVKRCISIEIYSNGAPRLYWVDPDGTVHNYVFSKVNVCTGSWNHIAIVRDTAANRALCYLNGELKQTLPLGATSDDLCTMPFAIGGDLRSANGQNFKGYLRSVAVYSDARTADEIKADAAAEKPAGDGLLAAYDLSKPADKIADLSGNGYELTYLNNQLWLDEKAAPSDYAYSFAVIGDTQIVTEKHPAKLKCIYDWIVANAEAKKIKFVAGLGDITNSDTKAEWTLAKENIAKLDGVVPYSIARGNHDSNVNFNAAFKSGKYPELLDGSYNKFLENVWQELIVGETRYLILTLDYGASDAVLNWAGEVIAAHPGHNVIITTHAYLFRDGTTLDQGDVCPPATRGGYNNGDHIWDKLIRKHENIVLVLSGHDPCDQVVVTQTPGDHGNIVTQMLIDPQGVDASLGATGMVAMLYFSADGKTVQVEYYSTVNEKFFMSSNQFTMEIAAVSPAPAETTAAETTAAPDETTAAQADTTAAVPAQTDPSVEEKAPSAGIAVGIVIAAAVLVIAVAAVLALRAKAKKK